MSTIPNSNRVSSSPFRVLITGGAGFIGSHLCQTFIQQGHHVLCVDNYSTGSKTNINPLRNHPHFTEITHDIRQPLQIDEPIDYLFHLACPASPVQYQKNPLTTLNTAFLGTQNMLNLAKEKNAVFLLASTSEVYGDPVQHPQSETYWGNVNPIGPRACYDEGKRVSETLCRCFRDLYHMPLKIARIFNTYGPNMQPDDGRVVSNFIMQALQNKPITLFGDGQQSRSFCYVSDMVNGLIRLSQTPDDYWEPINLGNPTETTMTELADSICRLIDSTSTKQQYPLPEDDPTQRRPDIQNAIKKLNWKPVVSLEAGLKETITYFRTMI